ncbi:MAG TPA: hypothetical protein VG267_21280 [Terracidiphilus sp.]|jgi:hypothetical protein|nr:hypothetical protein [Terracidiphilus sp.]
MEADSLSQSKEPRTPGLRAGAAVSAGAALAAGAALRLWMLHKFFEVNGDSQLYGSMAKNLLLHGQYAVSDPSGALHSTLIRLPGYPLFLAACFRIFGMENYFAPACLQGLAELAGCVLLALLAWRIAPGRRRMAAAQGTLWLACLCPFTAVYDAEPLTEALTLFSIALALWAVARFQEEWDWTSALAFTFAVTCAALLRPDGALVGVAFVCPMVLALLRRPRTPAPDDLTRASFAPWPLVARMGRAKVHMAAVCLLLALAPFTVWTQRNARVFHVFEPLAPRYATDPGENTWPGWQRWVKSWSLDFVSTWQIYWNMPGDKLDIAQLPGRAFDSPAQRAETERLFAAYEDNGDQLSPELDSAFAQLARERIAAHPLRYYVWLPAGRVLDMTFRPRVENLPIDLDWWIYKHHNAETRFSWLYAGLNAMYVLLALAGLCLRPRLWVWMAAYMVLRGVLLATIEAPEARYTLEFFPIFFVLGGTAIGRLHAKVSTRKRSTLALL